MLTYEVVEVLHGELPGDEIRVSQPWSLDGFFFLNPPSKSGGPWTCIESPRPYPTESRVEAWRRIRQAAFDKVEELHWKSGATRVTRIRVEYAVHFTHLQIFIDEELIGYWLRLQGPGEYHKMKCSDEKLQSLAQGLLSAKLFSKEGKGTGGPFDRQHNPPYRLTVTFEDGTRLWRSVAHDETLPDGKHREIRAWLTALRKELRENTRKKAEKDEGNGE